MKIYYISHMDNETKEKNNKLYDEIKNNGRFIESKWGGDYLIATYYYQDKIYELWDNMELEIRSQIVEKEIEEGTILEQDTCDEIQISLNGDVNSINEHTEHWLVQNITPNTYELYNLDTKCFMRVKKDMMKAYLIGNHKMGIKPMFRISNEKG